MTRDRLLRIGPKLIAVFLVVGLVPVAIVGFMSYRQARDAVRHDAERAQAELAFNASDKLDRNLFERYGDVQAFAQSDPAKSMDAESVVGWMDKMMATYTPIYNLMVVADRNGRILAANTVDLDGKPIASSRLIGINVRDQAWFKGALDPALKPGVTIVEDLHVDELARTVYGDGDRALAMSFTYPIRDDAGEIVGVWINRFNWQVATDILGAVRDRAAQGGASSTRLYLVSTGGIVLASDTPDDVLKRDVDSHPLVSPVLVEGAKGSAAGKGLEGDADLVGYYRSAGFSIYPGVGWAVLGAQTQGEALAAAREARNTTLVLVGVAALVIIVVSILVARSFSRPIASVSRALAAVATGDAGRAVDVRSRDEIGDMAVSYRAMQAYLRDVAGVAQSVADGDFSVDVTPKSDQDVLGDAMASMVANVSRLLGQVGAAVSQLNAAKDELADSAAAAAGVTRQIASSSDHVASGAGETARSVSSVSTAMGSLKRLMGDLVEGTNAQSRSVEQATRLGHEVAGYASQVAELAGSAAEAASGATETAAEGASMVTNTIGSMASIKDTVAAATAQIARSGERSSEIGKIVAVIEDIAAQTNLLALNAAIEAARAGEQGRGFAVVADEVGKLAERVTAATREIADLIVGIQEAVGGSVASMAEGSTKVEDGMRIATSAGDAINAVLAAVSSVEANVRRISGLSQDLRSSGGTMVTSVATIEEVVSANARATGQMQDAAQAVADAIGSVAAVADENSAATEEVAASTQEMTAQVEHVATAASEVGAIAGQLQERTSRFRLRKAA